MPYYVYLLRCADGSLYTGIAADPARRFAEHQGKNNRGAKYTAAHPPLRVEAVFAAADKSAALRLELRIKALGKAEKEQLIRGETPKRLELGGCRRCAASEKGELL